MSFAKAQPTLQHVDIFSSNLSPFLKWPGGKSSEIKKISEASPKININRFIEPFVGGGSVLLSVDPSIPAIANDICPELIDLYESGSTGDKQLKIELLKLSNFWEFITSQESQWLSISSDIMDSRINTTQALSLISSVIRSEIENFDEDFNVEFTRRITKDLPSKLRRLHKLQIENV